MPERLMKVIAEATGEVSLAELDFARRRYESRTKTALVDDFNLVIRMNGKKIQLCLMEYSDNA